MEHTSNIYTQFLKGFFFDAAVNTVPQRGKPMLVVVGVGRRRNKIAHMVLVVTYKQRATMARLPPYKL